jgi:hypothetical protein
MSVAHQRHTGASKHRWIAVTCRLAQAGRCTVRATISAKSASKLHLKVRRHARTFTLGSASRALAKAGTARLHIKLSRRTAQALRRPRSLRVTFRTAARYADGQTRSRTTHATLRR